MFSKNKIFFAFILIVFFSYLNAQFFGYKNNQKEFTPFSYSITPYPHTSRDSVKLNINLDIPYSSLQFLKKDSAFEANFETSIYVYDKQENLVHSEIEGYTLKEEKYKQTASKTKNISLNLFVPPQKYTIHLGMNDFETQDPNYRKEKIDLKNFYKSPITISYINVIEQINDTTKVNLQKYVPENAKLDTANQFFLSFQVLTPQSEGKIKYKIQDEDNNIIEEKEFFYQFEEDLNKILLPINKKGLEYKEYKLKLTIQAKDSKASRKTSFRLHWKDLTNYIDDLEEAIKQLIYIASNQRINKIMQGDMEEKKRKFLNFWDKKDPTPTTNKNELMIEYYRRVKFANKNFSSPRGGWRSDRGKVYIIFGPPDRIEEHTMNLNTRPYIIWYYRYPNKTFYFVDVTGFGDYKLQNPGEAWIR